MTSQFEPTPLEAVVSSNIKCIRCIEVYVQVPDGPPKAEAWEAVQDAVTYVPSWQSKMVPPDQMVMACVTVPVCIDHVQVQKPSVEQMAQRSGLAIPGVN